MQQDADLDRLVRQRIRALRTARGWSLDALAERTHLSPSNLSRLETGGRRIALDQLVPIARALDTTVDHLLESGDDEDVVIRPTHDAARGTTSWTLAHDRAPNGLTVAKIRLTEPAPALDRAGVHPGRDWFTVLSGVAELRLGDRLLLVPTGSAAEFSTMTPHALGAHGGTPAEVLVILSQDGRSAHLPR
ncbi:helix-turn-helix domain-containing protein [Nakamurella leprariae]|uniref:Helix-turn-helix domain-containing protein n=1 Tax=Nakamurella leprariae TaxID=2803911 RepID=A0A938YF62_9ACTN|nr:helix-turn-helix transcriptional regulator [Nakamurella leprariae]MBM9468739.1 helix-turn-helix domain-containing protein [Nakamurella leprariae]